MLETLLNWKSTVNWYPLCIPAIEPHTKGGGLTQLIIQCVCPHPHPSEYTQSALHFHNHYFSYTQEDSPVDSSHRLNSAIIQICIPLPHHWQFICLVHIMQHWIKALIHSQQIVCVSQPLLRLSFLTGILYSTGQSWDNVPIILYLSISTYWNNT